uniref:Olfactory receptor n=1 Tax=Pan troglodytes TaxID=9598 RepID=A0A2I3SFL0_PANTR
MTNSSVKGDFILVGFSDQPHLEKILFVAVLISYLFTLVGNTVIILIFDICFTTSIVSQLLWNLKGPDKTITFLGCVIQLYISLALGSTECVLLAVMAFDRYAAVCKPPHYTAVMNPQLCQALAGVAWLSGVGNTLIQGTVPSMIKLACVDIHDNEVQLFVASLVLLLLPLVLILLSYGHIAKVVIRIKSVQAWCKGLGTCGSHLIVVSLFCGTITAVYIQSNSSYVHAHGKFISLFYTVVTPTLNPLIYTLRNNDVKGALRLFNRDLGT